MKTLRQHFLDIQDLIKKYPQWVDLPICYSTDDEGNSYQIVTNTITPAKAEIPLTYNIDILGQYDLRNKEWNTDVSEEDVNIIIIN